MSHFRKCTVQHVKSILWVKGRSQTSWHASIPNTPAFPGQGHLVQCFMCLMVICNWWSWPLRPPHSTMTRQHSRQVSGQKAAKILMTLPLSYEILCCEGYSMWRIVCFCLFDQERSQGKTEQRWFVMGPISLLPCYMYPTYMWEWTVSG